MKRASDFPDFAAKAIFLLFSDQVIPGLRICSSSNSELRSPWTIFLINLPSSAEIRYRAMGPDLLENIAILLPSGERAGATL